MAGTYDFEDDAACDQGSTFQRTITLQDGNGDAIDLTGYSARMQVRKNFSATSTYIDISNSTNQLTVGDITLGGVLGTLDIHVPDVVTDAIPAGKFRYDIEIENSSGVVTRILMGSFQVLSQVTR